MKRKAVLLAATLVLVLCCTVGGTLAWLTASTSPVVNTFTYGDINIILAETTGSEYKMLPGVSLAKDPKVSVRAGSEACWLFVKLEASDNYSDYLEEWTVANGWTALTGSSGVYYREVSATDAAAGVGYYVLSGNSVGVKQSVTKAQMEALKSGTLDEPTLTVTAYAVQKDGFASAAAAWAQIG